MEESKPRVYVESTVVSYLVSLPGRDIVTNSRKLLTREFWERSLFRYQPYVSSEVIREISAGDPDAAELRLNAIGRFPVLVETQESRSLADAFLESGALPSDARPDAVHIAIAAVHEMEFLVTWNCRHIANGQIVRRLTTLADGAGCRLPMICTPEWLMEESRNARSDS